MKWHLCNPLGVSERTTEADSEFWAKRRFVPIAKGWFVASDASYQMGWQKADIPIPCAKCFRNLPVEKSVYCEPCRLAKRREAHAALMRKRCRGIKGKNAESETRAKSLRQFYAEQTPEQREARKAKFREIMPKVAAGRTPSAKERVRQLNIREGIARRATKRAQQLSLFGA